MRRPSPRTLASTTLPALASLLAHCTREPAVPPVAPPPHDPPPQTPSAEPDAGLALEPVLITPGHIPPVPLGGAPMPVTPLPSPAPAPAPAPHAAAPVVAAPMAAAPMAAAPMASAPESAARGVYIVHHHAPGTACRPISQTELQQALDAVRARP